MLTVPIFKSLAFYIRILKSRYVNKSLEKNYSLLTKFHIHVFWVIILPKGKIKDLYRMKKKPT